MKISVVIPLYNKRATVLRALKSVFSQTFQPEEIIVVNDGSTDGSEQIVTELNNSLVRLIHQSNAGVSAARNRGIREAIGNWIAFLDADDEWLPRFLEKISDLHKEYNEALILATNYFVKLNTLEIKEVHRKKLAFQGETGMLNNYFRIATNSSPPLWSSAIAINREILFRIGGFPQNISAGEDLLTWAKLVVLGSRIAYCTTPLSIFHFDNENADIYYPKRSPAIPDMVGQELSKLLNSPQDRKSLAEFKKYIAFWHKMRASTYFRFRDNRLMIKEIIKSLFYNPFQFKILMYLLINLLPDIVRKPIIRFFSS
jgi:glycosyltransferase involved in cell wall biosynthesis